MNIYTVKDVAKILSIQDTKVREYIRAGHLPASKISDRIYRMTDEDLQEFMTFWKKTSKHKFKKYISFSWDEKGKFQPKGGMNDVIDSYETVDEAESDMETCSYENWQIVDRDTFGLISYLGRGDVYK